MVYSLQSVGRASSRRARLTVGAQVGAVKSTVSVLDSVLCIISHVLHNQLGSSYLVSVLVSV